MAIQKYNVRVKYPYIAIVNSKSYSWRGNKRPSEWVIHKFTSNGIILDKWGNAKNYFTITSDFKKAISNVRKWYFPNLKATGWTDKKQYKTIKGESEIDLLLRIKSEYI